MSDVLFFPMWLVMDVAMVVLLILCAVYTRMIYREIPAGESLDLYWGWLLIAALDCGFIVVDFMPAGSLRANVAEIVVALRIFPIIFLTRGMYGLYKALRRSINGKK